MEQGGLQDPDQPPSGDPSELVKVKVMFDHKQEKWSHDFRIAKGSTVIDLKKSMVDPAGPPDDWISFDLVKQRLRVSNLDTLDEDDTLDFKFLGPHEGRRLLEKDKDVRAREEEATRRLREEEAQRREAERVRQEELARQREEEEQRKKAQEAEAKDSPKAAEASAAPAPEAVPEKPPTPAATPPQLQAPAGFGTGWIWTQKGVDAVQHVAWQYGNPEEKSAFTEEHLNLVKSQNSPMLDYASLSHDGFITFGMIEKMAQGPVLKPQAPAPAEKGPEERVWFTVTHKESRHSAQLSLPSGQTVFDLKKALASHVNRGPSSKLTLMYRTGKLLGDSAKLDALSDEDKAGLLATGLELGPPVLVSLKVYHASKAAAGTTVMLDVLDTASFQEVKRALCDRYGAKATEVRLVTKKPGMTGFAGVKDSDRIQGLREVGAMGKLMDRVASGEAQPVAAPAGSIDVEVVHAKTGCNVVIQVQPDATILQLREATIKALGKTDLGEVTVVKASGGDLVTELDTDLLAGRTEVMILGCDLPNPP